MKNFLLLLFLAPTLLSGQSFKQLVQDYEKHCDRLVADTVTQTGTVSYETIPVKNKEGVILHYNLGNADTTWNKVDCPEYKHTRGLYFTASNDIWSSSIILENTNVVYTGAIQGTAKQSKTQVDITQKYVCKVKFREIEPFSDDFWEWIKNN